MNRYELFVASFLQDMSDWELRCSERLAGRDRGEIDTNVMWEANEKEYRSLMDRYFVQGDSVGSGRSFANVSGYNIEKISSSDDPKDGVAKVFTRRFRPGVFDASYYNEVHILDHNRLALGRRFFRVADQGGDDCWDVIPF